MAADPPDAGMDTCPSPEIGDSRKRPLDCDTENGSTKRSHFSPGKYLQHSNSSIPIDNVTINLIILNLKFIIIYIISFIHIFIYTHTILIPYNRHHHDITQHFIHFNANKLIYLNIFYRKKK